MTMPSFFIAALATWRITHLLAEEDGPGHIVTRLRLRAGNNFFGSLLDCFYCLSVWIAAPLALFCAATPLEWLVVWPALSGAACLLEKATSRKENHELLQSDQETDDRFVTHA